MLSLLHKKWILRNPSLGKVNDIACALDIPPVVAQLLVNRKIETVEEANIYIKATLSSLHDPFLIKGMELAVERILRAIKNKDKYGFW